MLLSKYLIGGANKCKLNHLGLLLVTWKLTQSIKVFEKLGIYPMDVLTSFVIIWLILFF